MSRHPQRVVHSTQPDASHTDPPGARSRRISKARYALRSISNGGETFFAILGEGETVIVEELRGCITWDDAGKAFAEFKPGKPCSARAD